MNKDEFLREVINNVSPGGDVRETAEFIWHRWLRLYAEPMPINPQAAWGTKHDGY
jgi:hypothetical protein